MDSKSFVEPNSSRNAAALIGAGPTRHADSVPTKGYIPGDPGNEAERFGAISAMFDAGTIRHLENCGVNRGWRCLEVGGGSGSIAQWLSDRVGPSGRVVVTDIDTRFLGSVKRPNLEVRQHNIVTDPLPERSSIWSTPAWCSCTWQSATSCWPGWWIRSSPGA